MHELARVKASVRRGASRPSLPAGALPALCPHPTLLLTGRVADSDAHREALFGYVALTHEKEGPMYRILAATFACAALLTVASPAGATTHGTPCHGSACFAPAKHKPAKHKPKPKPTPSPAPTPAPVLTLTITNATAAVAAYNARVLATKGYVSANVSTTISCRLDQVVKNQIDCTSENTTPDGSLGDQPYIVTLVDGKIVVTPNGPLRFI